MFVTGCDSGMGLETTTYLSGKGYHVFAACLTEDGKKNLSSNANVTPLVLDVTREEEVAKAAEFVEKTIAERKLGGLFGVLQCAGFLFFFFFFFFLLPFFFTGIAFTAPFEYIPMSSFKRQMDVNFYGYVYVARALLPLLKKSARPDRRGRICFVSSGPLPGPGVPFITSYLAAKWAGEAVMQGLQIEFAMRNLPIDCVVLSPGIVKPTRLAAEGDALLEKTFREMEAAATVEYKDMVNVFRQFQMDEPGTHVSQVALQMERIMTHERPFLRYFVGYDAMASIVVGILPTKLKHLLIRNTLFRKYGVGKFWVVPYLNIKIYHF